MNHGRNVKPKASSKEFWCTSEVTMRHVEPTCCQNHPTTKALYRVGGKGYCRDCHNDARKESASWDRE